MGQPLFWYIMKSSNETIVKSKISIPKGIFHSFTHNITSSLDIELYRSLDNFYREEIESTKSDIKQQIYRLSITISK